MTARICVFDAYGTLFDVGGAARKAAAEAGAGDWADRWPSLAADWRKKQLEYTWLRAVAGAHADFWQVTGNALDWALDAAGIAEPALRQRLMLLYRELPAFPEVPEVLAALRERGIPLSILSNGTPEMLAAAVGSAGLDGNFAAILSVEAVGVYKPHPSVYRMATDHFGMAPDDVLFVSSNGWDACAAAAFGFRSVWVNRDGAPPDRLHGRPAHELRDLAALPRLATDA